MFNFTEFYATRFRFDSRLGLILIFDLDLALIPTIFFMQQGPGLSHNKMDMKSHMKISL